MEEMLFIHAYFILLKLGIYNFCVWTCYFKVKTWFWSHISLGHQVRITSQRKRVCCKQNRRRHCFPRSLSPGNGGALTEEAKMAKRVSDTNRGIHLMEITSVVSKAVSPLMCFPVPPQLQMVVVATKPAHSFIQQGVFVIAVRLGFLGQIWILRAVFEQ